MADVRRVIGFWDLVLFYSITTFSVRSIATAAAAGPSAISIWVIACVAFFFPLAYCVRSLSSRLPEEGGLYVWTRQAFGDFAGFITGWNYWGCNLPFFVSILYFGAGNALFIGGPSWQALSTNKSYFMIVSLAGLALGIGLNVIGLNVGKWLPNVGAISSWIATLLLLGLTVPVWFRYGSATAFSAASILPSTHFKDVIFWSTIAFALSGMESASVMAGEIRNAKRNIPRAIVVASVIVVVFYIASTASVLIAVPEKDVTGLQGFTQAFDVVAARSGVRPLVPFVAALVSITAFGSLGAWFATAARLPFVAGVNRFLPEAFGRVHPKWGTPHVALGVQGVIAAAFVFVGQAGTSVNGAFEVLLAMSLISYFIPYLLMFASLIKLDSSFAGRLCGALGFLTTGISIVLAAVPADDDPNKMLAVAKTVGLTLLMLLIGSAVYAYGRRQFTEAYAVQDRS